MGILLTIILGGIAGWIASMIMKRNEMGAIANIVVGVLGALLANAVIAPLLGVHATLDRISLPGFLVAVLGATLLLGIVNLFTRRTLR